MAPQGQVEARIKTQMIADRVFAKLAEKGIETPKFDKIMLNAYTYEHRDTARQFRAMCDAMQAWNLAPVNEDGSVKTDSKSVFTARFVNGNYDLETAVDYLVESGQFGEAVDEIVENRECPESYAREVTAFNVFIFAKGWMAERTLNASDAPLSKVWESQDMAGMDMAMKGKESEYRQIKAYTYDNGDGDPDTDSHGVTITYYARVGDTLHYGPSAADLRATLRDHYAIDSDTLKKSDKLQEDLVI